MLQSSEWLSSARIAGVLSSQHQSDGTPESSIYRMSNFIRRCSKIQPYATICTMQPQRLQH